MRIKKLPTGNQYKLTKSDIWVRNFTSHIAPFDINKLSSNTDYSKFLDNEITNSSNNMLSLEIESSEPNQAVIVSDGYKFKEKQQLLSQLPPNVIVISTNRTLVKWKVNRKIDYYIVNNPYQECMNFMPNHRYYPKCVASTKTFPKFLSTYRERGGTVMTYVSSPEARYSSPSQVSCRLDDYRNPICAGISLAYRLGVVKLLLLCCDDSFDTERPASTKLENGLWMYPQHLISHNIIDGMLYWYKDVNRVKIANHSSGPVYEDVPYISEEETWKFFN